MILDSWSDRRLTTRSQTINRRNREKTRRGKAKKYETFLPALQNKGITEKRTRPTFHNIHYEIARIIGNLDISLVALTGCHQNSKSLMMYSVLNWAIYDKELTAIWVYDTRVTRLGAVPNQFVPMIECWGGNASGSRQNTEVYYAGKGKAYFRDANTSSLNKIDGAAQGRGAVNIQGDILFIEERSQSPYHLIFPYYQRLEQSCLLAKPVREVGTQGGGSGIEATIKNCTYHLYPHITCECCGTEIPLNPKGCLLKPQETKTGIVYLSATGRPVEWFHGRGDKVATAFFACPECSYPISRKQRVENSYLKCLNTGVYVDHFDHVDPLDRVSVGVEMPPLIRDKDRVASDIIRDGQNDPRPANFQQQTLGCSSVASNLTITAAQIARAIGLPVPTGPKVTVAGIDCGTMNHWITIMDAYGPTDDAERTAIATIEETTFVVREMRAVTAGEIPGLIEKYEVRKTLIDNEPFRDYSGELCEQYRYHPSHEVEMFDQKGKLKADYLDGVVYCGSEPHLCWFVHNGIFLSATKELFARTASDGTPRVILPDWMTDYLSDVSEKSPVRHLTSVQFKEGVPVRPSDHNDDMMVSSSGALMAYRILVSGDSLSILDIVDPGLGSRKRNRIENPLYLP